MEGKYKVFKAGAVDDLLVAFADKLTPEVGDALNKFLSAELDDAVVIRRQDVFAPPALDGYANSITVALSLDPEAPNSEWGQSLKATADYFHEQALLSWDTHRKVPD